MDLTQGTEREKDGRAKKMMLAFGIVGLFMGFAGWTSAYLVSRTREDWVSELTLPSSFFISTAVILLSSLTYILAVKSVKQNKIQQGSIFLGLTLVLGISFSLILFSAQMIRQLNIIVNDYLLNGDILFRNLIKLFIRLDEN